MASADVELANKYLGNETFTFTELNDTWKKLTKANEVTLARQLLAKMLAEQAEIGFTPDDANELCRQLALWTSKDPELNAATRHDDAIRQLRTHFDLADPKLKDSETLGIAGAQRSVTRGALRSRQGVRRPLTVARPTPIGIRRSRRRYVTQCPGHP